ncbi:MAG TPA: dihydrodipicolinate synthase family protein [Candidatus Dietzia intestinipullorum]|nr:dihydrodipicolinate synthase family protein [Candidatus Dietzia intestinipullorum]
MFEGLSAFPLTPYDEAGPDLELLSEIVGGLADAGVDSICALGSTGGYAYLSRRDRWEVARAAVRAAGNVPVIVGVGALSTREVRAHVRDAGAAGAAGVLLSPMSYQPLRPHEVYALFEEVSRATELPVVVYDNPSTTGFTFTEELHTKIAALRGVASIKLPGVASDPERAREDFGRLRELTRGSVTLGVSGDSMGARGLLAGCVTWYSVLAGVFPRTCLEITRAARGGEPERALELSARLDPIWEQFEKFGSYRVVSAIAVEIGLMTRESLHRPVLPLAGADREAVRAALRAVGPLD